MLRRTTLFALPLGAGLALTGCHTTPAPPPSQFGPVRPAESTVSLTDARPFLIATSGEASRRFKIVAGDDEGRVRIVQVRAHDDQNILVRTSLEDAKDPLSVQSFAVSAEGDLVSWRDTNYAHEVFTEFDPPMIIFPREFDASGAPITQSVEFIVHPLADRQKVKQRGKAEVTITLLGRQAIQLPGGEADAIYVQTKLVVDFGPAKVERTTDEWFLPGVGLIADSFDEQIKVLGVTTEHTTQTGVADSVSPN